MPHLTRIVCICGLLAAFAATAWSAEDDKAAEAAKAFESLYAADVKRVKATRDAADDIELAKRLLTAADEAKTQPAFLAVLCNQASDLAAAHPDGYETAVQAMDVLATAVPARLLACGERVVDIRQKQYDAARVADRAAAGENLIQALVAVADLKAGAGAASDAATALKRAQLIARAVKSPRQDEIDARIDNLAQVLKAEREIEGLKTLLEKTPDNQAAREKLVRLYLVDLDNPAEAAKHLAGLKEESLIKYVPAAARGVDAAPELACAELGDWYRGLGETVPAGAKAAMYARARAYYQRFLDLHAAEDLNRTAATLALKKVETELDRLGGPPTAGTAAGVAKVIKPGAWVDLMPMINLAQDAAGGSWSKQDGRLVCAPQGPKMRKIALPVQPEGDYEFEVRLVAIPGLSEAFPVLALPGGHEMLVILYIPKSELGLEHIDGKNWVQNGTRVSLPEKLVLGKEYAVHCRVLHRGQAAARIDVAFQGKPLTAWEGAVSRLRPGSPNLGFGVWDSPGTFAGARLRMISGQAKVLRSTGAAAAAVTAEGEVMKRLGTTGGKAAREDMTTFKGKWGASAQLWWSNAKPGDRLDLALPVEAAGKYRLKVAMTKANDYAVVQLYLDGRQLGKPIDLYSPQVVPTGEIDLGTQNLTAGEHRLSIGIVGANPAAAKAYMAGLDYARLEPVQE